MLLLVAVIFVSVFGYKFPAKPLTQETLTDVPYQENASDTTVEKKHVLTELGCPSKASYSEKQLNSRIPWDLCVFDSKLFIGCGDYDKNTGPCDIWQYDLDTREWSVSGKVEDEAIINFEIIQNQLITTGTDPKVTWEKGSFYIYTSEGWQTDHSVPFGVHMFDVAEYQGKRFYAIGNQNNTQSPIQVTSDGVSYTNALFYIDEVALIGNPDYGFSRCYNLFENGDDLFAFCWWSDGNNKPKMTGIFKYDGEAFHYVSKLTDLGAEYRGANRQLPLNKSVTYNGRFYFSTGYLYSTDDFKTLKTINIPNDPFVQDMTVNGDSLYILTSAESNDIFQNTVWEYNEADGLKEVYTFPFKQSAISLEKHDNKYFVGIGRITDSNITPSDNSPYLLNGTVLVIEPKQPT